MQSPIRAYIGLVAIAFCATLVACGGGGGGGGTGGAPPTAAPTGTPTIAPTSQSTTAPLASGATATVNLGAVSSGGVTVISSASMTLPAPNVASAATVGLTATLPTGLTQPQARLKAPATINRANLTVLGYFTLSVNPGITVSSTPAFTLVYPSLTAGAQAYVALYDPTNASAGWNLIMGPVATTGSTLTFPAQMFPQAVSLAANTTYTFAVLTSASLITPTPSPTPTTAPTSTPTATPTPTGNTATVTGTVVDFANNTPLTGIAVDIATSQAGPYSNVATTNSNGQFSFSTAAGTYYLQIGSGSTSGTQTTLHQKIVLSAGSNPLTAPSPEPIAAYTTTAAQTSGNFRLMTLSTMEQDCLSGANQGRTNLSLPLLMPDEYLMERALAAVAAENAANSDTGYAGPDGLYLSDLGMYPQNTGETTSFGYTTCSAWTGPSYSYVNGNPPYQYATNASLVWYGADDEKTSGSTYFGDQYWVQP